MLVKKIRKYIFGESSMDTLLRLLGRVHRRLDRFQHRLEHSQKSGQAVDKGTQILLSLKYRELAQQGTLLGFHEIEFRNFSQCGEDGILHYIFSLIGSGTKRCIEISAGDGTECNSANLIINQGWHALLVDGDKENVRKGVRFFSEHADTRIGGPVFVNRWVDRASINKIIEDEEFTGNIDLLSLDIDGVDYWVWEALTSIEPRVVVVEYIPALGEASLTVPYADDFKTEWVPIDLPAGEKLSKDDGYFSRWSIYGGASLAAFNKLAKRKGYRLIGTNSLGFNAFFMRDDVGLDFFPEVSIASCSNPYYQKRFAAQWEKIRNKPWQEV